MYYVYIIMLSEYIINTSFIENSSTNEPCITIYACFKDV